MRLLGYIRRSQDSGTGVSEEIQRAKIEQWAALYEHQIEWLPPDLDASSWTLERPGLQQALEALAAGKADGIVAATQDRLTRKVTHFYELLERARAQGWHVFAVDTNLDTTKDATLHAVLAVFAQREYEEKRDRFDAARQNAVLTHGIHGGDSAPLGYSFTVRGQDKKGNAQRGPLAPNADAARVLAAFEARVEGQSLADIARLLGLASKSAARKTLTNRVYLGEAKSGEFVKAGAHEGIVSPGLFARVQRTFERKPAYRVIGRDDSLLARVLRCGTCGHALVLDRSIGSYRCKYLTCTKRTAIRAQLVEGYVFHRALAWHATLNPMYELEQDSFLPVLSENLAAALAQRDQVEAANEAGELSPVAYGKALTLADAKVQAAEALLAEAEAGRGWHGQDTDAVQRRLLADGTVPVVNGVPHPVCKEVAAGRDFIRQMVRVTVNPVGRGRKVPVADRVQVEYLTPAAVAQPTREETRA
jgi:site-specific DNA recombinase